MTDRGFTLVELVLALTLLALVASLLQGTYTGAVRSRDRAAAETLAVHQAAVVLDRLADEVANAFVSAARPETTGFSVESDSDGNASLVFTTRLSPLPGIRPGGPVEVAYFLESGDDGIPRLYRRESAEAGGEDPDLEYPVLNRVLRFSVRCYDGQEWVENWDSRGREEEPYLPLAVSVEVAWGDGERERVIRTATPIYGMGRKP